MERMAQQDLVSIASVPNGQRSDRHSAVDTVEQHRRLPPVPNEGPLEFRYRKLSFAQLRV